MPNWCSNELVIKGEEKILKAFAMFAKSYNEGNFCKNNPRSNDFSVIDAQRFIPRPKSLDITSGTSVDYGLAILKSEQEGDHTQLDEIKRYPWAKKTWSRKTLINFMIKNKYADIEQAKIALENIKKYGCKDWYEWDINNWGTKWNFCDATVTEFFEDGELVYHFETAWSPPIPVIIKMGEMFPQLRFELDYIEEGMAFKGTLIIDKGKIIKDVQCDINGEKT